MNQRILNIIDLLKTEFQGVFAKYHYGDPKVINWTELPAIFVMPASTDIQYSGTRRDLFTFSVIIFSLHRIN